ncbi:MAG: hypothetical protein DMF61_17325 [Blastocatellia bacterium AA13]|nr:MAG: hypothetical protein DMF61_17325 [Blastocatellia bacterium AA13]
MAVRVSLEKRRSIPPCVNRVSNGAPNGRDVHSKARSNFVPLRFASSHCNSGADEGLGSREEYKKNWKSRDYPLDNALSQRDSNPPS